MKVTIFHNPRCSKSRETLALLRERGVEPLVVEYLKEPPDEATLTDLVRKLGVRPRELLRKKEAVFAELGLSAQLDDDGAIIRAMAVHPVLIERPIVVAGHRARLGRPPERILELLE
jgi:arsenate reductase (glutaredoxin)